MCLVDTIMPAAKRMETVAYASDSEGHLDAESAVSQRMRPLLWGHASRASNFDSDASHSAQAFECAARVNRTASDAVGLYSRQSHKVSQ